MKEYFTIFFSRRHLMRAQRRVTEGANANFNLTSMTATIADTAEETSGVHTTGNTVLTVHWEIMNRTRQDSRRHQRMDQVELVKNGSHSLFKVKKGSETRWLTTNEFFEELKNQDYERIFKNGWINFRI